MLVISCLVAVTLHTWMLLLLLLCRLRLNGFLLRRHSTLRTTTYLPNPRRTFPRYFHSYRAGRSLKLKEKI
ncbi:hypothetical protein M440DRAFT_277154 [Trichoderma longibrachiatum ATCC 18648]|uniref:Uncharacterized protein n=1 Tax=Trichoderma longibrachiatum ATCC 18648 TaxID=983965 RepID=A0A2T4C6X7_TRILO|nr:hypothetical protein M440DRAFT_277154 [Trichoderma longibrachiatum ATCC 18648]